MKRVLILGMFVQLVALADTAPTQFRDWYYVRQTLAAPLGDSCVAYTEAKVGTNTWRLSIVHSVSWDSPVNITISTPEDGVATKIYSQTNSSTNIQMFYRSDFLDAGLANKSYWFAPSAFSAFYNYIRQGSALKLQYWQGTNKQLIFSLMGSTAATSQIAQQCNGGADPVPTAYYDFVDKLNIAQVPAQSGATVSAAWDDLQQSWDAYLESGKEQAALKTLQAQIDPLVAKEKQYLAQNGQLTTQIQSDEDAEKALEATVANQQSQVASLQAQYNAQNASLQSALVVLKQKEDAFAPVSAEGKPYFSAVDVANQRLDNLNAQISSNQSQIRQLNAKINSLFNQITNYQNTISSLNSDLSNIKSDRIRAQNAYMSFDVERDVQSKLSNDWSYQNSLREKNQSDRDLITKRDAVSHAQEALRQAQRDLHQCQQVAGKDCSSFQSAVNNSQSRVDDAQRNYASEQSDNLRYQQELTSRETALRSDSQDQKQRLANAVTDLDIQINDKEGDIAQNQSNIDALRNNDIPRAQQDLSSAQNALLSSQAQLDSAQGAVQKAEQDLASFKARTDYDRKQSEYNDANNTASNIRSAMASLDSQVKKLQATIVQNNAKITWFKNDIQTAVSNLAASQQDLAGIEAQLAPLNQQKADQTAKLAAVQKVTSDEASGYRAEIRDLPNDKAMPPKFSKKFWDWL